MTETQWLLDLVEEATPGPWKAEGRFVRARSRLLPHVGLDRAGRRADEDARLIALAPDLASLCVEQHEALTAVGDYAFGTWDGGREKAGREAEELTRAALDRFEELKP